MMFSVYYVSANLLWVNIEYFCCIAARSCYKLGRSHLSRSLYQNRKMKYQAHTQLHSPGYYNNNIICDQLQSTYHSMLPQYRHSIFHSIDSGWYHAKVLDTSSFLISIEG